ncbi:MAG: DEAD/DEAH box helicase [Candidatus Marinimicrobia bacterium]|nr:DEAD/DEAH box helicase [Candidatus Neomarinimicrobiota bacterium]
MPAAVVADEAALLPPVVAGPPVAPGAGVFGALLPALQRAVADEGYAEPTPIQEQAIPHVLEGRDLLGCAQTGTGKTAAFVLPLLQRLLADAGRVARGRPRALILAPTRELAAQIGASLRTYGRHVTCSHTVLFGGVSQRPQVVALRRGVDVVVATPGRLLDLMNQGQIRLDDLTCFVLDEADRMLDMGFLPDIRRIIARLPAERQTLFFSATLETAVVSLAQSMVRDPVHIAITPRQPTVARINQKVLFVDQTVKPQLLAALLDSPDITRVLVFTRMKHSASRVAERLHKTGVPAVAIHGNKSQNARNQALADFKAGRVRVLVATDIAARGLDVDGITHVINYDLPLEPETYIHRIGRTARAGAAGDAISFCSASERGLLTGIERLIRKDIPHDADHAHHSEAARAGGGGTGAKAQGQRRGPTPNARRPRRQGSVRSPARAVRA